MYLLSRCRVWSVHSDANIRHFFQRCIHLSGKGQYFKAEVFCTLCSGDYVFAGTAGRKCPEDVTLFCESFDLSCKDVFIAVIVCNACKYGGICAKGYCGEGFTISFKSSLASSTPATSSKVIVGWSPENIRARDFPKDMAALLLPWACRKTNQKTKPNTMTGRNQARILNTLTHGLGELTLS